jgi:hypothetical protein
MSAPRVRAIAGEDAETQRLIDRVVSVAQGGLPAMFEPERGQFVHHVDRHDALAGESVRYGAMVALGARWLEPQAQREIFGGETAAEFVARLISRADEIRDLGDLATVAWAAGSLECGDVAPVLLRLSESVTGAEPIATVELAWSLSAFVAGRWAADTGQDVEVVCARLLAAFSREAGVFPHVVGGRGPIGRHHVACFADQAYPIQALSRAHAALGKPEALAAATRCAEQICELQGPDGQWWWHYDARTGAVIEGYPVYSVHQDAMGPMALFDLQEAGGPDNSEAIRLSLRWMEMATEVGHTLIDEEHGVIWRKVGRAEPGKLVRAVRAGASWIHPRLRVRPLDSLFPTTRIDYECRPYHLGWVLDTWLAR